MKLTIKVLAVAAFMAMTSGAAFAADAAMKMDCCAKCDCCKDKGDKPAAEHQDHK